MFSPVRIQLDFFIYYHFITTIMILLLLGSIFVKQHSLITLQNDIALKMLTQNCHKEVYKPH